MTTEESIPYKFIKLSNGEDIICTVEDNDNSENQIKVIYPLKMQMLPKMLTGAEGDSIGLSQWIQPMTEAVSFQLSLKHVLLISDASPGLIKYYEYVLKQMRNHDFTNIDDTDDDDNNDEETYEELLDDLPNPSKLIH
jgi:hypothetical protein